MWLIVKTPQCEIETEPFVVFKGGRAMNVERMLRMVAGAFVLLSLALGYWVSPYWYLFTAFVGLNLFQSAFTNWCPMMTFLRKMGVQG
jgi:hypothetical protein